MFTERAAARWRARGGPPRGLPADDLERSAEQLLLHSVFFMWRPGGKWRFDVPSLAAPTLKAAAEDLQPPNPLAAALPALPALAGRMGRRGHSRRPGVRRISGPARRQSGGGGNPRPLSVPAGSAVRAHAPLRPPGGGMRTTAGRSAVDRATGLFCTQGKPF